MQKEKRAIKSLFSILHWNNRSTDNYHQWFLNHEVRDEELITTDKSGQHHLNPLDNLNQRDIMCLLLLLFMKYSYQENEQMNQI